MKSKLARGLFRVKGTRYDEQVRNFELARAFGEIADLLELQQAGIFRIRAYRRAAQNLESLSEDVEAIAGRGELDTIPGIGKDLAAKIDEYLKTEKIAYVDELHKEIPPGVVELMGVQGVGPKTAKLFFDKLGIDSIEKLEAAIRSGQILGLPGIKEKTRQNILKGIVTLRAGQARMPLGKALPLAEALVGALKALPEVRQIEVAGSIRRRRDTVGNVDILVTSQKPATVMERFVTLPAVAQVLLHGETKSSIRHREGIQVDLRVVESDVFGAALQYFTGSQLHNVRLREMASRNGLRISEYGVFNEKTGERLAGKTEEEVYRVVRLPWIPAELRGDRGEIDAAMEGRLPSLLDLGQIRGDLHAHTDWSDGHHPLPALVEAAEARGYEYIVVSDHSRSSTVARGLTPERLRDQIKQIRELQKTHRIRILTGTECDILPDGSLDFPNDLLQELDVVLAAVHSRFKQSREEMTARICRALEHPLVTILAHPTGRLIGVRDAYDVDLEQVFATARRHGKAVEINASPYRLDLNDLHARRARDLGCRIAVNTDTHYLANLDHMSFGVATARRAWVGPDQVMNTAPLETLLALTRSDRR